MSTPPKEVWCALAQSTRQEIIQGLDHVLQEVLDEHFRFDSASSSNTSCSRLRTSIDSESSTEQSRESAPAIRLQQRALELGWHEQDIDVVDIDQGITPPLPKVAQGFSSWWLTLR